MKRILAFTLLLISALTMSAQGSMPVFTTAGQDTSWYYIQFQKGSNVLSDPGTDGAKLVTATKSAADGKKWALIGTKDNFRLVSRLGGRVIYSDSRFCSSKTADGATFRLINGSGCWEIQRTNSSYCMNQWGGTATGVQLGEWSAGDGNNGLNFVIAEAQVPKFSTDEEEHWYFIEFARESNTILDQGSGTNAILAKADPVDGQLWKLVGSQANFQLISRLGNYATVSGTGNDARLAASATPYPSGYSLVQTTNATYAPAWEIKANGITTANCMFNQWQGAEVGHPVGFWSAGDVNDPLHFVSPDDMVYDDYKVSGDFKYSLTPSGNICIEGCTSTDESLVIPSEIDGKKVTDLGKTALGTDHENSPFVSVTIPASVEYISEENPFMYCTKLKEIKVESGNADFIAEDGTQNGDGKYSLS